MTIQSSLTSPFKYRLSAIGTENNRYSISTKDINKLCNKKIIREIDSYILASIYKYRYINRKNIEIDINSNLNIPEVLKLPSYKKRLAVLSKYGLVIKNYFYWTNNESIIERTPIFYTLSRGALYYLKRGSFCEVRGNTEEYLILESPEVIFMKLAFNQFLINIKSKSTSISEINLNVKYKSKLYKASLKLPGLITMKINDETISIMPLPVRRIISWENELISRLTLIKDYLVTNSIKYKDFKAPIIIFICEDDSHIKEVEELIINKSFPHLKVLYTTDNRLMEEQLSSSLLTCKREGSSINLLRYKLNL